MSNATEAVSILNEWRTLARVRTPSAEQREQQRKLAQQFYDSRVCVLVTSSDGQYDFLVCGLHPTNGVLHVKAGATYMDILHDDANGARMAAAV